MAGPGLKFAGWRLLGRELGHSRRALLALAAVSLVEGVPALVSGRFVAYAVDQGFLAGRLATGLAWLAAFGVAMIVGAAGSRAVYPWIGEIVEPLRDALVRTVVNGALARGATAARPDPAAVARLTRQVEVVRDIVAGQLIVVRQFVVTAIGVTVGVGSLAPQLVGYVVAPLGLALVLFAAMLAPMVARQRALLVAEERIAAAAAQVVGGVRDIVACGAERRMAACAAGTIDEHARIAKQLAVLAMSRRLVVATGAQVPLVLILLAAPRLTGQGLSAGAVIGAITYVTANLQPALHALVQGVGAAGPRLAVALTRIAGAASPAPADGTASEPAPEPAPAPEPLAAARPQRSCGDLELHAVTFSYGTHAEPVVQDLTLTIRAGEHVAVVGPSGAGKSTLANLIAGLTAPDTGEIRLAGRPLTGFGSGELHRIRALIPQEAYAFAGTMRENLCYSRPDVPDPEVRRAARLLGLDQVVRRIGGYDRTIDPNALSAGERQLIALVRAYLATAPLVVLDEATCHLDAQAEARVEGAFRDQPGTLVVIAHRISSARRADRILLMDGTHTALGTHHDLLATEPLYADLVGHWVTAAS